MIINLPFQDMGVLILCLSLCFSAFCFQTVPNIFPYQAHSFNDLNIAHQLMLKGVKYFKFDASLANEQSCLGYSSWKPQPCIDVAEYAQEMCCLAMRGDASSAPNFHYPFNTSSQFTALLEDFLSQHHQELSILFVAIDFQFSFAWGNSLAETFMAELAELMHRYSKLHVTCKGDYILQYDRICRYASPSTTQDKPNLNNQQCTPRRKSISNSPFFLQSGSMEPYDPRDYKNRTQNFNIIYTEISRLCSSGFPEWINRNPSFPLIFWEPSNQQQIQTSLAQLMSPECRSKHNRTLEGIALASNIDPQMFLTAMKGVNPEGSVFPWKWKEQKAWLQNATSVHLVKICTSSGEEKLVVYRKTNAYNESRHFLSLLKKDKEDTIVQEKEVEIHEEIEELRGLQSNVVAVVRKSARTSPKKQFDAVLMTFNADLKITALLPVDDFLVSTSQEDRLYFLVLTSNPQEFQTYSVAADLRTPTPYKLPVFLPQLQMQSITSILFQPGKEDLLVILGNDAEKTWVARIQNSQQHTLKTLTFGTNAQILATTSNRVVITLENSYNHGGLLINNNGQNSCIYHQIQRFEPLAHIKGLVDFIDAPLQSLAQFLDSDSDTIATACHPTLPLAKLMNGESMETVQIWSTLLLSTRMIPLPQQDLISTLFGGSSNYLPSLIQKKGFLLLALTSGYHAQPFTGNTTQPHFVQQ